MASTVIEFILVLIAHAIFGIYSATLKYSKKTIYIVWGSWVVLQSVLLCYTEFVLTDMKWQFFVGFFLSLIGQYALFFLLQKEDFPREYLPY